MALLSMTAIGPDGFFVEGEIPFLRGSNGGFRTKNVKNALSFNGID
jgi:hypothetical protein